MSDYSLRNDYQLILSLMSGFLTTAHPFFKEVSVKPVDCKFISSYLYKISFFSTQLTVSLCKQNFPGQSRPGPALPDLD